MAKTYFEPTLVNKISVDTNKFIKNYKGNSKYRVNKMVPVNKGRDVTGSKQALLPFRISTPSRQGEKLDLVLFVNPESVNMGTTHHTSLGYTRQGYIPQYWGPNQNTITATGRTAAFITDPQGLTNMNRKSSISFLNYMSFLMSYRNNGYRYFDPTLTGDNAYLSRVINMVQGVEIFYDDFLCMGHFNNFTMDETADRPFSFTYNFEFIISSLSSDYSGVKGHFEALPIGEILTPREQLVNSITIISHGQGQRQEEGIVLV